MCVRVCNNFFYSLTSNQVLYRLSFLLDSVEVINFSYEFHKYLYTLLLKYQLHLQGNV